jgi:hypothetical protein
MEEDQTENIPRDRDVSLNITNLQLSTGTFLSYRVKHSTLPFMEARASRS